MGALDEYGAFRSYSIGFSVGQPEHASSCLLRQEGDLSRVIISDHAGGETITIVAIRTAHGKDTDISMIRSF